MKKPDHIKTSLWQAQIWGGLILGSILFFAIGQILQENPNFSTLKDPKEFISFICFPVLTCVGLELAYKWPGLGGFISI